MQFHDYYGVLGVARDATAAEIKKAYRALARKYHPDVSREADTAARMSAINEAHAVLSDPERRAAYDALGQGRQAGDRFTPPPDWDAGFEFSGGPQGGRPEEAGAQAYSDFFTELFAALGRQAGPRTSAGRGRGRADAQARGEDHHAKILLDIADAWRGARRRITLRVPRQDEQGHVQIVPRELEIDIPAGVKPGQHLRLAGQGGAGAGGGPPGDLLLQLQFKPDARFRVAGADLVCELPLAPWEAALGAVVPVALPDGSTLKVRVPAGAQCGRSITVRGYGLPARTPGDLELQLRVVLPASDDPRARRLFEQMAAELPDFDARRAALR